MTSLPTALTWRGALAVAVGIVSIAWPHVTVRVVVVLFAVYVLADAVGQLALAYRLRGGGGSGHLLLALLDVAAAALALGWPSITATIVVVAVGLWAIVTGAVEMAVAWRFAALPSGERTLLAIAGAASALLGVVLLAHPDAGALALAWLFGLFSLVFGLLALLLGHRLRRTGHDADSVADQLFGRRRP